MAELDKKLLTMGEVRLNSYAIIEGSICKITEVEKSMPSHRSSPRIRLVGVDLFNGQKKQLMKPAGAVIEVPIIEKKIAQVIALSGTNAQIMDMESFDNFELPIPEELQGKLESGTEIEYLQAGNQKIINRIRANAD